MTEKKMHFMPAGELLATLYSSGLFDGLVAAFTARGQSEEEAVAVAQVIIQRNAAQNASTAQAIARDFIKTAHAAKSD